MAPTKDESNTMAQSILTDTGIVVPRRSVRPLTTAELHSETERSKREGFDTIIKSKLGNSVRVPKNEKGKN